MNNYKKLSGKSFISSYKIGSDNIIIMFNDDGIYLYNYNSTSKKNIDKMKSLAKEGLGLNTYI